jgi:fido (protein-threonine AMPylation protein)
MYKWTKNDLMKLTEMLIDADCPIYLHPKFRKGFDRKQNLFANQVIRESQGNVAYRSVDFEIDELNDGDFWGKIDDTKYNDLIEENAASAMLKMAARLNLLN